MNASRALSIAAVLALAVTHGVARTRVEGARTKSDGAAVVPFDSSNDLIVLSVTLDGKGPFRLVLDTGATGHAISPQVAEELGLKVEGSAGIDTGLRTMATAGIARVGRVGLGGCTLADQVFFVAPLPPSVPFQGFLGAEVFRRFAVAVDFRTARLTLTPAAAFDYKGGGTILPLKFYKRDTPQVRATVGGVSGWFKLDTGYNDALALFPKFVAAHRLDEKYEPQRSEQGGATLAGEVGEVSVVRVPSLKLGAIELRDTEAAIYRDAGTSNDAFAGAIGTKLLERFHVIFDYRGGRLILEAPRTSD
ncbi:MAG: aspartyl protease family protein [Acidobacteria bacterium]|nr:aspartyl protease family protein [Acidobacteriota bacterium]